MITKRGFTLVEIIISISILALAAAALGTMQINSISLATENRLSLRSMAYASETAEKMISEGYLEGSDISISEIQKDEETDKETDYSCTVSIESVSYSSIPVKQIYIYGKNGGREYARYKIFKIQGI